MNGHVIGRFLRVFTKDQDAQDLLVLASRDPAEPTKRNYKRFPAHQVDEAANWCMGECMAGRDVYYKSALLKPDSTRMVKENFQDKVLWLWADVDNGRVPQELEPTFVIESSPGRYQALWRLAHRIDKWEAEGWSKAIAYTIRADASGWDIGQELRVPGTHNLKYDEKPEVKVVHFNEWAAYSPATLLERGIKPEATQRIDPSEMPQVDKWVGPVPAYLDEVAAPERRSVALWRALCQLRDDGWTKEDAFKAAWWSPLNKYRLDNREPRDLWRDIEKCWSQSVPLSSLGESSVYTGPPVTGGGSAGATSKDRVSGLIMPNSSVETSEWPLLARKAIETFRGPTLFREEAIGLVFLSAYSAAFPHLRIGDLNLGLWTLLLGNQAAGKTTLIQNLTKMLIGVVPHLGVVTSGSPEGIIERVAQGPSLLSFDEYSEQLKLMQKREGYAATNKELYQRLFDGAPFSHATRKAPVFVEQPFAVMMAGTNAETWRQYGQPEDISNGYLSRFVVIAADLEERSVDRSGIVDDLRELGNLVAQRVALGGRAQRVYLSNAVGWEEADGLVVAPVAEGYELSFGDSVLADYQRELEGQWPINHSLDEEGETSAYSIPPGRTLTKVRKIASLLELAEANPQVDQRGVFVRERNVRLACRLGSLSQEWAGRAISWLGQSEETPQVQKILRLMGKAEGKWIPAYTISQGIRGMKTFEVQRLLGILAQSGLVERQVVQGQNRQSRELWRLTK